MVFCSVSSRDPWDLDKSCTNMRFHTFAHSSPSPPPRSSSPAPSRNASCRLCRTLAVALDGILELKQRSKLNKTYSLNKTSLSSTWDTAALLACDRIADFMSDFLAVRSNNSLAMLLRHFVTLLSWHQVALFLGNIHAVLFRHCIAVLSGNQLALLLRHVATLLLGHVVADWLGHILALLLGDVLALLLAHLQCIVTFFTKC